MKRILALLLASLMLVCAAACGKSGAEGGSQAGAQTSGSGSGGSSGAGGSADAKLTGKLDIIDLSDRDASVLRGVRIIGNQVGSYEDINGKPSSLTDVRCLFALNEWVDFYPDTDAEYALRVWVLEHRDDPEYYSACKFSDLMPGFAAYCDLHYPADSDVPEEWTWGSFYLSDEEFEPGYYDFVFTYEGKAIAVLLTRFCPYGELEGKTGAELEALMKE